MTILDLNGDVLSVAFSQKDVFTQYVSSSSISNRVFNTPRHRVNTLGADRGHRWKQGQGMRHIFEVHQSGSKRETGLTAPDLPRRLQECLHTPSSPRPVPADQPDGPYDLLWTSVANSSQMDNTDRGSDPLLTAAGSRPSPIYTHTFFSSFFYVSLPLGGNVLGQMNFVKSSYVRETWNAMMFQGCVQLKLGQGFRRMSLHVLYFLFFLYIDCFSYVCVYVTAGVSAGGCACRSL